MSDSKAMTNLDPRVAQEIAKGPRTVSRGKDSGDEDILAVETYDEFATRIALLSAECEREAWVKLSNATCPHGFRFQNCGLCNTNPSKS